MTRRQAAGFTLMELVVTVAIVTVLALLALPLAELEVKRSRERDLSAALLEIRAALDAYHAAVGDGHIPQAADGSGYPPDLETLVSGVPDTKSPTRRRIYFLRRIPRDPMSRDATLAAAQTWGLRSYASPPEEPEEGDDVYDVYSLADGIGMNGIPYRQW